MTEHPSELEFINDAATTSLRWREAIRELPWVVYHQLRRIFRREPRMYLVVNGRVAARFTSDYDHLAFLTWINETHTRVFEHGYATGGEITVAKADAAANSGAARTP